MRRHHSCERAAQRSRAPGGDGRRAAGVATRALAAASVATASAVLLARAASRLAAEAPAAGPGALQGWVACCAVAVGAVALLVIGTGCLLTTVGAAGRAVGCTLGAVERAGARLTPAVVRRALVLGLGAALVAGVTAPASAHEPAPRSIAVRAPAGTSPDGDSAAATPASAPPLEFGWSVTSDDPPTVTPPTVPLSTTAPAAGGTAEPASSPATPPSTEGSAMTAPPAAQSGAPASGAPASGKNEPVKAPPGASTLQAPTAPAAAEPAAAAPSTAVPAAPAPTTPTAPAPPAATPVTVVVRPGDSLWSITADLMPTADDAALAAAWPRLYAANLGVVGADPDLIRPGQVLTVPVEELS